MAPRRYLVGAEVVSGGTSFRVWAPDHRSVTVVADIGGEHRLSAEADGYFSAIASLGAGSRYRFRLDDKPELARLVAEGRRGFIA